MQQTVQKALSAADKFKRNGDMQAALSTYDEILARFPQNAKAQRGKVDLEKMLRNPPDDMLAPVVDAITAGDWAGAAQNCTKLLANWPNAERVWRYAGLSARNLGHADAALPAFQRVVAIHKTARACCDLAETYQAAGNLAHAVLWHREAVELSPKNDEFLSKCGRIEAEIGDFVSAAATLGKYLTRNRDDEECWALLGRACLRTADPRGAIAAFKQAVRLNPRSDANHANLGVAYQDAGRLEEAQAASKRAVSLNASNAFNHINLGNQYLATKQEDDAIQAYGTALNCDPTQHEAMAQKLHLQARQFDWSCHQEFADVSAQLGISGLPIGPWSTFSLEDDLTRQKARSANYARKWPLQPRNLPVGKNERIRVGYFTSDLYEHATMHLLTGILEQHDKNDFDIFLYGMNVPRESESAERAKAVVTEFRDVHAMSDAEIVRTAREDKLDIAVDLKGYTKDARSGIFFYGVAPIQINYLGYPGTMGSACMDYIIADPVVIPEAARAGYSESVIYMPQCYQPNDNLREIAPADDNRADHALPDDAFVLCCFNSAYKIGPAEFDTWARVLNAAPDAVLWLLDPGETGRANLIAEAAARGVEAERLIFAPQMPQAAHLARYRHADLFLDTFNCNAHTTASDALWAGLPLITIAGEQFAARVAASLLTAMESQDLICADVAAYEELILKYHADRSALRARREQLSAQRQTSPLFDTAGYTKHLETAYRKAVAGADTGPQDIHVAAD